MYKTCSYFVVCDFLHCARPQKSKNAEIPKQNHKTETKQTENHLDKRYPLHNLSTYHCNVSFYADPSSTGRQMKYRKDLFPLLDTREITACLLECEFNVTQELIVKPTADFVTNLFEQFLDTFMGIPLGTIRKKAGKCLG